MPHFTGSAGHLLQEPHPHPTSLSNDTHAQLRHIVGYIAVSGIIRAQLTTSTSMSNRKPASSAVAERKQCSPGTGESPEPPSPSKP